MPGEHQPLALPAGETIDAGVRFVGKSQPLQQLIGPASTFSARAAARSRAQAVALAYETGLISMAG